MPGPVSTFNRLRTFLGFAAIALLSLTAFFVSQAISADGKKGQTIDLPTLPPPHVLHPELRNEDGCTAIPPDEGGGWRCGPQVEGQLGTESFQTYQALCGFEGPYYSSLVSGKSLVVLENTLNTSTEGNWAVHGLLRNETTETVGEAVVVSRLYGYAGERLGEAKTLSPVRGLRPGEPAPFHIEADVDVGQVYRVEWEIAARSATHPMSRDFMVLVHWEVPYGVMEYGVVLRDDPPYPYLLATGMRNLGEPVQDAQIIAAWLNDEDQVILIAADGLRSGTILPIDSGEFADFETIQVFDSGVAHKLHGATPVYWVIGELGR